MSVATPDDLEAHASLATFTPSQGATTTPSPTGQRAETRAWPSGLVAPASAALRSTDQYVEALQTVEQAQQAAVVDHETLALRADLLADLGRSDEALSAYLEASARPSKGARARRMRTSASSRPWHKPYSTRVGMTLRLLRSTRFTVPGSSHTTECPFEPSDRASRMSAPGARSGR